MLEKVDDEMHKNYQIGPSNSPYISLQTTPLARLETTSMEYTLSRNKKPQFNIVFYEGILDPDEKGPSILRSSFMETADIFWPIPYNQLPNLVSFRPYTTVEIVSYGYLKHYGAVKLVVTLADGNYGRIIWCSGAVAHDNLMQWCRIIWCSGAG